MDRYSSFSGVEYCGVSCFRELADAAEVSFESRHYNCISYFACSNILYQVIPQRGMRYKKLLPVDMALSPYRPESFDGFVKNKLPGKFFSIIKLFFCIVQKFFVPRGVKIYR